MKYRGWNIWRGPDHPITGQWRADRFGIRMGNTTREGLLRMIDLRVEDERTGQARFLEAAGVQS